MMIKLRKYKCYVKFVSVYVMMTKLSNYTVYMLNLYQYIYVTMIKLSKYKC